MAVSTEIIYPFQTAARSQYDMTIYLHREVAAESSSWGARTRDAHINHRTRQTLRNRLHRKQRNAIVCLVQASSVTRQTPDTTV